MMFGYGNGWGFWPVAAMWIGMIVFLGSIGWGIYAIVTSSRTRTVRNATADGGARTILDARFARGDLDEEAYQRARTVLVGGQGGGPGSETAR